MKRFTFLIAFALAVGYLLLIWNVQKSPSKTSSRVEIVEKDSVSYKPITWTLKGEKGFLTGADLKGLNDSQPFLFRGDHSKELSKATDTVGYYICKDGHLWIEASPYRWWCNAGLTNIHAKREKGNRYKIQRTEIGPEEYGECGFDWEQRLQSVGPLVILHPPSSGSGYCASFLQIFRLDGTEVKFYGGSDDDWPLHLLYWNGNETTIPYVYRYTRRLDFKDGFLLDHCVEEELVEKTRVLHKRSKYTVRYELKGNQLTVKDTLKR